MPGFGITKRVNRFGPDSPVGYDTVVHSRVKVSLEAEAVVTHLGTINIVSLLKL